MKKLTVFEMSIIGFFVGVVVSAYVVFLSSTEGFVGKVLGWIALLPILKTFRVPSDVSLLVTFIFVVFAFVLYGIIIALVVRMSRKGMFLVIGLVLLLPVFVFIEQKKGTEAMRVSQDALTASVVPVQKVPPKAPEVYYGLEARGDLNADGKDDTAFIIPRDDEDGIMYYMSVALKDDKGHVGVGLVYLGSKIEPKEIKIEKGVVEVGYVKKGDEEATTTKKIFAEIIDGKLKEKI